MKELDEWYWRRFSAKGLANDLGEGGAPEGLKSVDSIINMKLHCIFPYMYFWTKTVEREI